MHSGLGRRVIGLARLPFLAIDRRDVDDAAPTFLHHIGHHLLGDVEHRVKVGFDHGVPVLARHLQEHAVLGDSRVVDQHVDGAVFEFCLAKSGHGGVPIAHIAHRRVEGVAQRRLLGDPFGMVPRWAATGDHLEALLVQALANSSSDTAHPTRDICNFLSHSLPLVV